MYSKTCLTEAATRGPKIVFQDPLLSLSTFINRLPFVIKIIVLSIFEWPLKPACADPGSTVEERRYEV